MSNDCRRVEEIARLMHQNGFSPRLFSAMVTAGEILHHHLAAAAAFTLRSEKLLLP